MSGIHRRLWAHRLGVAMLTATLSAGAAWADKPEWAGRGQPGKEAPSQVKKKQREHRQGEQRQHRVQRDRSGPVIVIAPGSYFNEGQRRHVHDWYGQQVRAGHCPPGLAKKNNGCLPPGQAKKWRMGHALPAGVVYYPVPQPVVLQLGVPPAGYRYVRVANDILLIAIGSRMVVDAIVDLGRIL